MKKFVAVVITFVFLSLCAFAQQPNGSSTKEQPKIREHEPNACSGEHKPGDHLVCFAQFDEDSDISNLQMIFNLTTTIEERQTGFPAQFGLSVIKKLGRGEYQVEGDIPKNATGVYKMTMVQIVLTGYPIWKSYNLGSDFKDILEVKLENKDRVHYPKITDVYAELPKEEKGAAIPVKK